MADTKPTIVVVDDSPTSLTLFERSIEKLDVELLTFSSANGSFEYLEDNVPQLIFLNIMMPEKDGLTYLRELRHFPLHKNTPVVIVSSKDYAQDRGIASELGALEFIIKPFSMQTIIDIVLKYTEATTTN